MKTLLLILTSFLLTTFAFAHDEENGISIDSNISSTINANKVHYVFDLYDNTNKKNITDTDLTLSHEKLLHLFIYDQGLKEFLHLHPTFENGQWVADFDLNKNGKYWIWTQGTLASDGDEFSSFENVTVINGTTENSIPTSLGDIRTASDNISVATITGKAKAGSNSMLMVKFTRNDGTNPEISDYLGAFAHAVIVSLDGKNLIHAHPMNTSKPNEGMLHVTFPKEGDYRVWIQFLDAKIVRTVPISIKVTK